jgi:hypothetical protein
MFDVVAYRVPSVRRAVQHINFFELLSCSFHSVPSPAAPQVVEWLCGLGSTVF